jgi:thiamine-phosphate pyrophosphorylase
MLEKTPLLCYITDRTAFAGDEPNRRRRLIDKIAEAASCGIHYIQLREKDLPARELEALARESLQIVGENSKRKTVLLINSRTDIAQAAGANGVHLPAGDVSPETVRTAWRLGSGKYGVETDAREKSQLDPVISVSCHSPQEVAQAALHDASFALFAPVFEKKDAPGAGSAGLAALRQACLANIPVLALGGVTLQNVLACLQAGAAGIAAIRLFQENDIAQILSQLPPSQ